MNTFLGELAQKILDQHGDKLAEVQIVFPNRRAGVFFRKELGRLIDKPIWLPKIYSMEDFVVGRSELKQVEKLEAVFMLYEVYQRLQPEAEHFDKFYFWGEMILKDFEEIDHYRVDADKLFTTIRSQKELDEAFFFLDEEDRKIIEEFWNTFLPDINDTQEAFLRTWQILHPVYEQLRLGLAEVKKGYGGMIYRQVAEALDQGQRLFDGTIHFAGFNALTAAEETIISWCVSELGAQVHWDLDAYYVESKVQEAGLFFREYMSRGPLNRTFPKELPTHFSQPKELTMTGVPLEIGQTKSMISTLEELASREDFEPEKTVIVLPHEYMLHPVLHAIPDQIELLNITMGYPLNASNTFGLIDSLLKLQHNHRNSLINGVSFYHKPLLELLDHPLIQPIDTKGIEKTVKEIRANNRIYVYTDDLKTKHPLIHHMLTLHDDGLDFLLDILARLDKFWEDNGFHDFELEFIRRYYQTYAQLRDMLTDRSEKLGYEFLIRIHRRISGSLKVPFTGEPLNGLQVMGILETRNLDFDHVVILNMNEDSWPAPAQRGSFVPFNIRKAFGMPVHDHQDAIYSYLFYRLLQRAKTAHFYYNTVSEFSMNGEPSRLLQQLELESLHVLRKQLLVNPITVVPPKTITIAKTERIYEQLNRFVEGAPLPKGATYASRLTPSALESYLHCRLKFYFRYVEQLYEQDELQEDVDAMLFGNVLHDAMELLYTHHQKTRGTALVAETDFFALETAVDGAINRAFLNQFKYKDEKKFQLEGRSVIAYEVIRKMVLRILEIDKKHAPFEIVGLEADTRAGYAREYGIESRGETLGIRLKGKIDRIDRKDGVIRVVDYKTGKDVKQFRSVESLTDREDDKRNKAAFQVLFYSWIVKHSDFYVEGSPVQPGLFNSQDLFHKDFDWKIFQKDGRSSAQPVHDFRVHEEAFEEGLKALLTEIWNPEVPLDQVEDAKKCEYCPYKGICGR